MEGLPSPLPIEYKFCAVRDLVVVIADMIAEFIHIADQRPLRDGGITKFHSKSVCHHCYSAFLTK